VATSVNWPQNFLFRISAALGHGRRAVTSHYHRAVLSLGLPRQRLFPRSGWSLIVNRQHTIRSSAYAGVNEGCQALPAFLEKADKAASMPFPELTLLSPRQSPASRLRGLFGADKTRAGQVHLPGSLPWAHAPSTRPAPALNAPILSVQRGSISKSDQIVGADDRRPTGTASSPASPRARGNGTSRSKQGHHENRRCPTIGSRGLSKDPQQVVSVAPGPSGVAIAAVFAIESKLCRALRASQTRVELTNGDPACDSPSCASMLGILRYIVNFLKRRGSRNYCAGFDVRTPRARFT
jgi:hypothetical protein